MPPPHPTGAPYGRMAHVAKDQLHMLPTGLLFTTPCMAARMSFRFYVMVMVCADGGLVSFSSGHGRVQAPVVVARPSGHWLIEAEATQLVAVLLNPTHPLFTRFSTIPEPGIMALPLTPFIPHCPAMHAAYEGRLDIPAAAALIEAVAETTTHMLPPRAERPLRWRAQLDAWLANPTDRLEGLAEEVGVSPDHMSRLFQAAVGLPMRSYLLWRKAHRITELFGMGHSLTALAHEAGFSDSAHMCRVFQDVFGASPGHFLRNDIVQMRTWRTHPGRPADPSAPAPPSLLHLETHP